MIIRLRVIIPQASDTFCPLFHDMIHETIVATKESSMGEPRYAVGTHQEAESGNLDKCSLSFLSLVR